MVFNSDAVRSESSKQSLYCKPHQRGMIMFLCWQESRIPEAGDIFKNDAKSGIYLQNGYLSHRRRVKMSGTNFFLGGEIRFLGNDDWSKS